MVILGAMILPQASLSTIHLPASVATLAVYRALLQVTIQVMVILSSALMANTVNRVVNGVRVPLMGAFRAHCIPIEQQLWLYGALL